MDKNPAPVLVVFFNPMILALIIFLKGAQNKFLKLTAAFARNDLDSLGSFRNSLFHDLFNCLIKFVAFGVDVVKV